MEEKLTMIVAVVGIAVAISRESREWYKATKKEKRPNPTHRKHKRK